MNVSSYKVALKSLNPNKLNDVDLMMSVAEKVDKDTATVGLMLDHKPSDGHYRSALKILLGVGQLLHRTTKEVAEGNNESIEHEQNNNLAF